MLSRGDLTINFPNIRQRTQENPYRAIPLANKSSIIRGQGGWCCKELATGHYIGKLPRMRKNSTFKAPTDWWYIGPMTGSTCTLWVSQPSLSMVIGHRLSDGPYGVATRLEPEETSGRERVQNLNVTSKCYKCSMSVIAAKTSELR